jgi:hypothetical protein
LHKAPERQLQVPDDFRRIFIIHTTPGSNQPIVDTAAAFAPAAVN